MKKLLMSKILFWLIFSFLLTSCTTNSNEELPFDEFELYTDETYPIRIPVGFELNLYADNLERPTSIEFPPDGSNRLFVNELNSGKIMIIHDGQKLPEPFLDLAQVLPDQFPFAGSRGLIGLEFHPNYRSNGYLYITYATSVNETEQGFIARVRDENNRAEDFTIIRKNIPSEQGHQVQNIEFGPDNMLYVSVGDAYQPDLAQDTTAWNGKVLRFTPNGEIPMDNPFGPENPVYALGFRNPYDLIFSENGELFVNDNGNEANDSFYKVTPGSNAGWPVVEGTHNNPDFIQPLYVWENTVVPTGMHLYTGDQFPANFRGKLFLTLFGETSEGLNPYGKRIQIVDVENGEVFNDKDWMDFLIYQFDGLANPIDITEGPDGRLFINDFFQGHIYSISYTDS